MWHLTSRMIFTVWFKWEKVLVRISLGCSPLWATSTRRAGGCHQLQWATVSNEGRRLKKLAENNNIHNGTHTYIHIHTPVLSRADRNMSKNTGTDVGSKRHWKLQQSLGMENLQPCSKSVRLASPVSGKLNGIVWRSGRSTMCISSLLRDIERF